MPSGSAIHAEPPDEKQHRVAQLPRRDAAPGRCRPRARPDDDAAAGLGGAEKAAIVALTPQLVRNDLPRDVTISNDK